jgi:hypothetical protein
MDKYGNIPNFNELLMITILCLSVLFFANKYFNKKEKEPIEETKETFTNDTYSDYPKPDYFVPTDNNPFGNLLLTDIGNIDKLPANESYNKNEPNIKKSYLNTLKKLSPATSDAIDMMENNYADKNNYIDYNYQRLYSTPSNTYVSNQQAFMEYLYGKMSSSKGYTADSAMQRMKWADEGRHIHDTSFVEIPVKTS